MNTLTAQLGHFLRKNTTRKNLRSLRRLLMVLAVIVAFYSMLFHLLMLSEEREFSWFTGIYWTLTVMSTLGFGDITFESDLGRAFSMCVLLTGTVYILILLPFSFIRFFYAPWMEAQSEARALRHLPPETTGHVLLTNYDEVSSTLIQMLQQYHYPYFLMAPNLGEALRLHDSGLKVVLGDLDNPEVYRNLQVERAAMVASTANDPVNTHVAFTVRELTADVPIIATADDPASVDILELAGCSFVLQIPEMLGQSLARRTHGGDARAQVIGRYGELIIAETTTAHTPMVGRTLQNIGLLRDLGITVVGVWDRSEFKTARPETIVAANSVLVLAGTQESLDRYNEKYRDHGASDAPTVIIGGGRVGRATARALTGRGLSYRIIEQNPELARESEGCVEGNAAELTVLKRAGIERAPTVIITTHDDDVNVYLTIYCRRLRSDIQILSRVALERNISTLHRAGADFVMSYASLGANATMNFLEHGQTLMVAEGLDVFKIKVPPSLAGKAIAESGIRRKTSCTIIAIEVAGKTRVNPEPTQLLPADAELILIGSAEGGSRFLSTFVRH
ncbi:MAG: potassium channel family protein [Planctomycetota bacterium]|jgi:Trk K+ transport system NAD-binding subunit